MKKKSILMGLILMFVVAAVGCGKKKDKKEKETEIIVYAAASLTESLEEIAENYKKDHPNVKITFNFDSSGTLKTQIEEGADCDLFISAAKKQMIGQLAIASDNAEAQSLTIGKSMLLTGDVTSLERIRKDIEDVTAEEILEVSREIFRKDRMSRLVFY